MERITHWSAKRAGGRITLTGRSGGKDRKVVGIDTIEATDDGIVATDKNNTRYILGNPC